jgi:hypothetical protein
MGPAMMTMQLMEEITQNSASAAITGAVCEAEEGIACMIALSKDG